MSPSTCLGISPTLRNLYHLWPFGWGTTGTRFYDLLSNHRLFTALALIYIIIATIMGVLKLITVLFQRNAWGSPILLYTIPLRSSTILVRFFQATRLVNYIATLFNWGLNCVNIMTALQRELLQQLSLYLESSADNESRLYRQVSHGEIGSAIVKTHELP